MPTHHDPLEDQHVTAARQRATQRRHATEWLETSRVLQQRLSNAEGALHEALRHVGGDISVVAQDDECRRLQYNSQLIANVGTVKQNPHRWLRQFSADVDASLHALDNQLQALGDVEGDALRVITLCTTSAVPAAGTDPVGAAPTPPPHLSQKPAAASIAVQQQQDHRPPAAIAYDRFVLHHGGHTLGWEEEDHRIFLQCVVAAAHRPNDAVLEACSRLPEIPPAEVAHHAKLYQSLTELQHERKIAIEAFRQEKEADARNASAIEAARRYREEVAIKRQDTEKTRAIEKRQAAIKQKVEAYKAHKAATKTAAVQAVTAAHTEKVRNRQERWETRRAAVEPALQAFRDHRQVKEDRHRAAVAEANSLPKPMRPTTTLDLGRRWEADKERIAKRQQLVEQKSAAKRASDVHERQVSYLDKCRDRGKVRSASLAQKTDPNRLTQPTAASKARAQSCSPMSSPGGLSNASSSPGSAEKGRGPMHLSPGATFKPTRAVVGWCGGAHMRN